VQYMYMGEIEMSEFLEWQGYSLMGKGNSFVISSPWKSNDEIVFGHDSNYTTMAISMMQYLHSKNIEVSLSIVDERIDVEALLASTGLEILENGSSIICMDNARLYLCGAGEEPFDCTLNNTKQLDNTLYEELQLAWSNETDERNISQGAYVSSQQYQESLGSRLHLDAQKGNCAIWPPRQLNEDGVRLDKASFNLKPRGKVITWTKLSAAGAPSEFSVRAPILGGITTVLIEFDEGPRGVFLVVDDENHVPSIDCEVELVVRMLYGQEGSVRYGTKARIIK